MAASTFRDIEEAALNKARVTLLPGTVSGPDKTAATIAAANRILNSWNTDDNRIYQTKIAAYTPIVNQQIQTLGPTGNWVSERPTKIVWANLILPAGTGTRIPLSILTVEEWERLQVQGIYSNLTGAFYPDNSIPNRKLYFYPIPSASSQIELYTWERLKDNFSAASDAFTFPDGMEKALVDTLTIEVAQLYGTQVTQDMRIDAAASVSTYERMNRKRPVSGTDYPNANGRGTFNSRTGNYIL